MPDGRCRAPIQFLLMIMKIKFFFLFSFAFVILSSVRAEVYEQDGITGTQERQGSFTDAFNVYRLGIMMRNFFYTLKDSEVFFDYLVQIGDMLLMPVLAPLIIICTGARVMQELHNLGGNQDILSIFYSVGAVILILSLYRYLMYELVVVTNSLARATVPQGYSFEGIMTRVEETVTDFHKQEKHKNVAASFINRTISLYTQYVVAWTSKWGVMILYSLLSYLRKFLFVVNYTLGIFLLPFLIVRNNSLPRNWLMITALLSLWIVVESVMVAAVGSLGVAALYAAMDVSGTLPVISESLFYIMVATVNILIGISLLTSIWIVKSYFLSPSSISTVMTLFSVPALAMAGMMGKLVAGTGQRTLSYIAAGAPVRHLPRAPRRFPPQPNIPPRPSPRSPTKTPKREDNKEKPDMTRTQKGPKRRAVIEYKGALPAKSLPQNITTIARVGKKKKL